MGWPRWYVYAIFAFTVNCKYFKSLIQIEMVPIFCLEYDLVYLKIKGMQAYKIFSWWKMCFFYHASTYNQNFSVSVFAKFYKIC